MILAGVALGERAKHLTTTAKKPHPYEYIHDEVGYNYRLPNLNAALGCAQLEQLDAFIEVKRALATAYQKELVSNKSNVCMRAGRLPFKLLAEYCYMKINSIEMNC